jgi:hypothetical protein
VNVCDGALIALGVFLRQNVETDVLCLHDGSLKTQRPHGGMPAARKIDAGSLSGLSRIERKKGVGMACGGGFAAP